MKVEIISGPLSNPESATWILNRQANTNKYIIKGFYYGSGSRWDNTVEVCMSQPLMDHIPDENQYDLFAPPVFYPITMKIENSNIIQISAEEVQRQIMRYDDNILPPIHPFLYPSITIDTEDWIITLMTRDLHRWACHPIEISGCSIVNKNQRI